MKIRTYSELITLPTFAQRYRYLKLDGVVGADTFGFDRYLNQALYRCDEWKETRRKVILRDNGCDLADPDRQLNKYIVIHHMNPLSIQDILSMNPDIFNPEYLICTSKDTHNAIHYGEENSVLLLPTTRTQGDTKLW